METIQLVYLSWLSYERDKHIWEDLYAHSWNEIIGRIYLLKANGELENKHYRTALADFKRALVLLAKDDVEHDYYARALSDKALLQCLQGDYRAALSTIDQALLAAEKYRGRLYHSYDEIVNNRGSILILTGAFTDALDVLQAQLVKHPDDGYLQFTLATCLLHMERYDEAIIHYEQAPAEEDDSAGLEAARKHIQPDWSNL